MKSIWILSHYAASPQHTGALRHYNLAKFLEKKGYDVCIFSASTIHNTRINLISDKKPVKESVLDGVKFILIKTRSYQGNGLKRILNLFDYYRGLPRAMKKFPKPDLILASSPPPSTCIRGLKYARKSNIPCICEVLDLWPESIVDYLRISRKNLAIRLLYKLEKHIYQKADQLVFSIEGGPQYIIDRGWTKQVDLGKIHHINMGIDLAKHDADLREYRLDNPELLDKSTFKIIYCGSIRTMNHVRTLVDAAQHFKKNNYQDIKIFIYGDGDQRSELESFCSSHRLDNVYFGGRIEKQKIPFLLAQSDLNILNYLDVPIWRYGGSQSKLFDYLASGKPILTNIRMGYSLLERYNCGIATVDQSTESLISGILQIYNLPREDREDMGRNARRAAQDFDQPLLVDKLIQVMEIAVQNGRKE